MKITQELVDKILIEHKLSTEKISPKKIISWYGENMPLSGLVK